MVNLSFISKFSIFVFPSIHSAPVWVKLAWGLERPVYSAQFL